MSTLKGKVTNPEAIRGKSAYEIAVANGYEGTEAEWVDFVSHKQPEADRVKNENTRISNENTRKSNENTRISNEATRQTNEAERQRNAAEYKAQVDLVREEIETWQDEWGKISSFDKRLENLEAAVSPDLVTPTIDSTVAYSKTVPKGVLPNAAVCEIGGMSYKSENLIPFPYYYKTITIQGITWTVNEDGSVTANGTATANSEFMFAAESGEISLNAGIYSLSGCPTGGSNSTYWLRVLKGTTFIQDTGAGGTAELEESTYYVFARIYSGVTVSNITFKPMLNKGEIALPYQPYFTGLRDSKVTAVESESANVYCGTKITNHSGSGITYEWNKDDQIITITASTSAASEVFLSLEEALNIVGGEVYSVSAVILADTSNVSWSIGACDSKNKYNVAGGYSCLGRIVSPRTYTFANDACLDMIHIFVNSSGTVKAKFKYMINKGSTALPYSPYFRESLPIPADALDGFGQGVSKDCYNKIVFDPAEGVKKFAKQTKRLVFDGTEKIIFEAFTPENLARLAISLSDKKFGGLKCTHYVDAQGVSKMDSVAESALYPEMLYFFVSPNYSTADLFKAYLAEQYAAGTPVTVEYALATPVETDVSHLFTDDNLLPVEAGGTITAVNEYEQAVPFTIEYTVKGA